MALSILSLVLNVCLLITYGWWVKRNFFTHKAKG